MIYFLVKVVLTTLLVVLVSEVAKKSSLVGAILASVPIVSVLAMVWLYIDTRDVDKVSALSINIFWLVLPSLILFISLPLLLRQGLHFSLSLIIAIGLTAFCYIMIVVVLNHLGINI